MADEAANRLSEPGSAAARRFLEDLQESIYNTGAFGRPVISDLSAGEKAAAVEKNFKLALEIFKRQRAVFDEELTEEQVALARKMAYDSVHEKMPTRFEEPGPYGIVTDISRQVENTITAVTTDDSPRPHPLIGTLPTGQVNAMAIRVPGSDEHIIVFESQIFNFCLLFSKAVALGLAFKGIEQEKIAMSTDMDDILRRIGENSEIGQRFFEVLAAYLIGGNPGQAPPYIPPEPWGNVAAVFRDTMEFFIMAHEYSHVMLDHTGSGKRTASLLGGDSAEVLEWSQQQEIEADTFGVFLLMGAPEIRVDPALRFTGVALFFGALSIVERALTFLQFGEERQLAATTHPAHMARLVSAHHAARDCPFVRPEDHEGIEQLSGIILGIIESLWTLARPAFARLREDGYKPHRMWTFGTPNG